MRRTRRSAAIALGAAAAVALVGCASGTPGGGGDSEQPFEVATDVQLEGSPTFDAASSDGTIRIGVKEDQPGLGYLDPVTGERTGFDVDMARWVAASLGFSEEQIEFQAIPSANREQALVNGDVDFYVGTYSITDARKEQIDFAGPYFVTGQGLLVGVDSEIASEDDLTADTTVCSATGSTPIQNIRDNYPDVPTEEFDTYSQCVEALINDQLDAVTTDQAILIGYAAQDPEQLQVVGEPFTEERYGIGLPKGDDALREHINALLEANPDIWQAIYDNTLGDSGVEGTQPEVDRY
ncbi:glutamate ABC transporter substrate-binding protein [Agrococcus sp. ARC_14]|uniref:glutamate ABC transporter substrate-binding protein n=1 Tax=Agrococcus sp. ARC_14 TaxID=2919927 RepID=UPI001F05DE4E|nr:glutamate ABC transporter substrate-binding protein [Agrococcus sp. ARC_14]MCH1883590.1 glutamate ABC transporter substrate-binding protein [Agrococcus sp. ARC_14]